MLNSMHNRLHAHEPPRPQSSTFGLPSAFDSTPMTITKLLYSTFPTGGAGLPTTSWRSNKGGGPQRGKWWQAATFPVRMATR
ncbi:hypothetical protein NL676_022657 [Syzygium grande]|nr:hypothetical protein NL676_022657 [Syzygium grande]